MISAGDFRNGITVEIEGTVYQILEFQHVKPGKGAAFVRTKLKDVINSGVVEKTFRPTEKFPQARIDRKDMQYLYNDGDVYNFMDAETYEQMGIGKDIIGDGNRILAFGEGILLNLDKRSATRILGRLVLDERRTSAGPEERIFAAATTEFQLDRTIIVVSTLNRADERTNDNRIIVANFDVVDCYGARFASSIFSLIIYDDN